MSENTVGMQLHSIHLHNVAGIENIDLDFPSTGVTVLHGNNESGKTTVFKAFELLISQVRSNSSGQSVRELRSIGVDKPVEIGAELTLGDYRVRYKKVYTTKIGHSVELNVEIPVVENLTGRRAEDRFRELLEENVDHTLLEELRIKQGDSLETFSAGKINSLSEALTERADEVEQLGEASAESSSVSVRDLTADQINARIAREFSKYFTPSGGQKKELKELSKKTEELQARRDENSDIYESVELINTQIAENQTNQQRLIRQIPKSEKEVEKRREAVGQAKEANSTLEKLTAFVHSAETKAESARTNVKQREEAVDDIAAQTEHLQKLRVNRDELEDRAVADKKRYEELREEKSVAEAQQSLVRHYVEWATANKEHFVAEAALKTAEKELADSTALIEQIEKIEKKLRENPVTAQAVQEFESASREVEIFRKQCERTATTVDIAGPSGEIHVGEQPIELSDAGYTTHINTAQVFGLGDYQVTVQPARGQDDSLAELRGAKERLQAVAKNLSFEVDDTAGVLKRGRERKELADRRDELDRELLHASRGKTSEELKRAAEEAGYQQRKTAKDAERHAQQLVDRWEADTLQPDQKLFGQPEETDLVTDIELAKAGRALDAVIDLDAVRQWRDAIEAGHERAAKSLREAEDSTAVKEFDALQHKVDFATQALEQHRVGLENLRKVSSDDSLADALAQAEAEYDRAKSALSEEQETLKDQPSVKDAEEDLRADLVRLNREKDQLHALQRDDSALRAQLGSREGAAEQLAAAEKELADHARYVNRITERARAIKLLKDTMDQAEAEMRDRYAQPLANSLNDLAKGIFPGASFELDDNLTVSRRVKDGIAIDVKNLSGGAQEQVNILSRLAVASQVAQGKNVPVFLDDSLGFADAERAREMNKVLSRLGENHQVIIATCDINRFGWIHGSNVVDIEQEKRQSQIAD